MTEDNERSDYVTGDSYIEDLASRIESLGRDCKLFEIAKICKRLTLMEDKKEWQRDI